jgi:hypothetical protein
MLSSYLRIPYRDLDRKAESLLEKIILKIFRIPKIAHFNQQPVTNPFSYLLKTHIYSNHRYKKIIYCVRDGRDVLVSYYFFQKDYVRKYLKIKPSYHFDESMSDKAQFKNYLKYRLMTKDFPYLNWAEHVERATNEENIIFIKYEDLKSETYDTFIKLLNNLQININEKKVRKICEEQAFDKEKERLEKIGDSFALHLKTGECGRWKELFSDESLNLFNKHASEIMQLFDYYQ